MNLNDPQLIGCWHVVSVDTVIGRMVSGITGRPGQVVQFTADGRFGLVNNAEERWASVVYDNASPNDLPGLDIWHPGWESAKCLYRVEGATLLICVPDGKRPRPKELKRHDAWRWTLMTLQRCECPPAPPKPKRRPRVVEPKFEVMAALRKELKTVAFPKPGTPGVERGWFDVAPLTIVSGRIWAGDSMMALAEVTSESVAAYEVPAGEYAVTAMVMAFGKVRFVARLRACLARLPGLPKAGAPIVGGEIGEAGTDSASIGLCDPKELAGAFNARFGDDDNEAVRWVEEYPWKRCGVVAPGGATGPRLVYANSGFGDGTGPVLELLHEGRRVGIELPFIEEAVA